MIGYIVFCSCLILRILGIFPENAWWAFTATRRHVILSLVSGFSP